MESPAHSHRFHTQVVITDSAGAGIGHGCLIAPQAALAYAPLSHKLAEHERAANGDPLSGLRATLSATANGPHRPRETIDVMDVGFTKGAGGDPLVVLDLKRPSRHLPDRPPGPFPKIADGITDLYKENPALAEDLIGMYREVLERHLKDTPPSGQIHDLSLDDFLRLVRGPICKLFPKLRWCRRR